MAHVHSPVIRNREPVQVNAVAMWVAAAIGWLAGTVWSAIVVAFTTAGVVIGTLYLSLVTLAYAFYYGFLKGAHIQLVPNKPKGPSLPM